MRSRVFAIACLLATCHLISAQAQDKTGPFGFFVGETKAQVLAQVGRPAVKKEKPNLLALVTAPKPHPEFEGYELLFSPTKGLLKVVAIGKDIENDSYGDKTRSEYTHLKTALQSQYGEPSDSYDFLNVGSIWSEDRDFMMGILKEERNLDSYWKVKDKNHIHFVSLNSKADNSTTGYLLLSYEFDGWDAYVDSSDAKDGSVL